MLLSALALLLVSISFRHRLCHVRCTAQLASTTLDTQHYTQDFLYTAYFGIVVVFVVLISRLVSISVLLVVFHHVSRKLTIP